MTPTTLKAAQLKKAPLKYLKALIRIIDDTQRIRKTPSTIHTAIGRIIRRNPTVHWACVLDEGLTETRTSFEEAIREGVDKGWILPPSDDDSDLMPMSEESDKEQSVSGRQASEDGSEGGQDAQRPVNQTNVPHREGGQDVQRSVDQTNVPRPEGGQDAQRPVDQNNVPEHGPDALSRPNIQPSAGNNNHQAILRVLVSIKAQPVITYSYDVDFDPPQSLEDGVRVDIPELMDHLCQHELQDLVAHELVSGYIGYHDYNTGQTNLFGRFHFPDQDDADMFFEPRLNPPCPDLLVNLNAEDETFHLTLDFLPDIPLEHRQVLLSLTVDVFTVNGDPPHSSTFQVPVDRKSFVDFTNNKNAYFTASTLSDLLRQESITEYLKPLGLKDGTFGFRALERCPPSPITKYHIPDGDIDRMKMVFIARLSPESCGVPVSFNDNSQQWTLFLVFDPLSPEEQQREDRKQRRKVQTKEKKAENKESIDRGLLESIEQELSKPGQYRLLIRHMDGPKKQFVPPRQIKAIVAEVDKINVALNLDKKRKQYLLATHFKCNENYIIACTRLHEWLQDEVVCDEFMTKEDMGITRAKLVVDLIRKKN